MTGPLSAEERLLVGSYRLVSFQDIADDGEVREPLGADAAGLIVYSAERCISAVLMRADRPNFADGDILGGSDAERVAAFGSVSAYAGRWAIEEGHVVHRLEAATFPNWTGTVQRRPYELDGDRLRLLPPRLLMDGKMRRSELTWQRLSADTNDRLVPSA